MDNKIKLDPEIVWQCDGSHETLPMALQRMSNKIFERTIRHTGKSIIVPEQAVHHFFEMDDRGQPWDIFVVNNLIQDNHFIMLSSGIELIVPTWPYSLEEVMATVPARDYCIGQIHCDKN